MNKQFVRVVAAALAAPSLLLAACSGGGSLPPKAVTSGPATHPMAIASFTIAWPAHAISSRGKSPHFISPSAMSVIVEANPNASTPGPVTFANASGASASTVTFDAPVGTDDFVFTLYDAPQQTGETQSVGNLLGQADVPSQTIVAGKINTINAVIGGVTAHVAVAPVASQPFVETDALGGYDIVGGGVATFGVTPYDADGNVIVAPGAPAFSFSSASAGTNIDLESVATNPTQFTVAAIAGKNSTAPFGVVVTATDSGVPHTASGNLSIYLRSALYVSYASGSGAKVAVYDDQGNAIALPSTAFAGIGAPSGVAYDAKDHRVFVADSSANTVRAFDAGGNAATGYTAPALPGARGVAFDPQSSVVYATGTASTIAFNPDGTAATLGTTPFASTATPDGITYVGIHGTTSLADDEIAIANDATLAVDYYKHDGTYIRSDVLTAPAAAPMVGLAWNGGVYETPMLVGGGPAGAGFAFNEYLGGGFYIGSPLASATTRMGGIAFASTVARASAAIGPSQYEAYVVEPDANVIAGYIFAADDGTEFNYPDVTIVTPSASGLSNPIGIAIAL